MTDYDQPIKAFMTESVRAISIESSLPEARKLMKRHGVRHLPVIEGDKVVGLLSDRELGRLEGFPLVDLNIVSVPDAMASPPYVVDPKTPLVEVLRTMREKRFGCAVVTEGTSVVGMFTTTDAIAVLIGLLTR